MSTHVFETFWLIDDGRYSDTLLSWGKRFPSEQAANADRKHGQGLLKVTGIATPGGRMPEVQS